ncbi:hypothetical protein D9758_018164 [Tetrapyrgos nigripes]|uniref:Uncharacterized protein n=1 Tax=Tetrapyrgos nigripes TaxID=182062 RepID=A0A8H5F9M6_9AGAR|nr:hypothetical protein D9758_018164 [Tetrapyrgos nigripes]
MSTDPSSRMQTRGKTLGVDVRIRTKEEVQAQAAERKAAKEKEKKEKAAKQAALKADRDAKLAAAKKKIAAIEDQEAKETSQRLSLRPDIDMPTLPIPKPLPRPRPRPRPTHPQVTAHGADMTSGLQQEKDMSPEPSIRPGMASDVADLEPNQERPMSPLGSPFDSCAPSPLDDEALRELGLDPEAEFSDIAMPVHPPETDSEGFLSNGSEMSLDDDMAQDVEDCADAEVEMEGGDPSMDDVTSSDEYVDEDEGEAVQLPAKTSRAKSKASAPEEMEVSNEDWAAFMEFQQHREAERKKEEAKKKRAEKTKEQKEKRKGLRASVDVARQVGPSAPIAPAKSKVTGKRKADEKEKESVNPPKRLKDSIGGLAKNWSSKVYNQSASSSLASSDHSKDFDSGGQLENVEAVSVSREAAAAEIKLVDADVDEIDKKESGRGNKKARHVVKQGQLPFPDTTFKTNTQRFQTILVPRVIDFVATLENPFDASPADNRLQSIVKNEWTQVFSSLPDTVNMDGKPIQRACHPAIMPLALSGVRTWRTGVGEAGMTAMEELWKEEDMKEYDSVDSRAEWVNDELDGLRFLYGEPDAPKGARSTFLGRLVITVFAYHVNIIAGPTSASHGGTYGDPTGALALCCTSVLRALLYWKSGTNLKPAKSSGRNTKESFSSANWTSQVKTFYNPAKKLTSDQWNEIFFACEEYLEAKPGHRKQFAPESSTAGSTTNPLQFTAADIDV